GWGKPISGRLFSDRPQKPRLVPRRGNGGLQQKRIASNIGSRFSTSRGLLQRRAFGCHGFTRMWAVARKTCRSFSRQGPTERRAVQLYFETVKLIDDAA